MTFYAFCLNCRTKVTENNMIEHTHHALKYIPVERLSGIEIVCRFIVVCLGLTILIGILKGCVR